MAFKLLLLGSFSVAGLSVLLHLLVPYVFESSEELQTASPHNVVKPPPVMVHQLKFVATACDVSFRYKDYIMGEPEPTINGVTITNYKLNFKVADSSMEMVNSRSGEVWYSGTKSADLRSSDLFLGNSIIINKKCFVLTAYSNEGTRRTVEAGRQSTFAMVKPDAMGRLGSVLTVIGQQQLNITSLRFLRLSRAQTRIFYAEHKHRTYFEPLITYITSGPVLVLQLVGPDAVAKWRAALGPTDSVEARNSAPASIRALFGTDKERNAAHGSDSVESAHRELSYFFPGWSEAASLPNLASSSEMLDASSCLVLPHIGREGLLGAVVDSLRHRHDCEPIRAELARLNYLDAARYATGQLVPAQQSQLVQEMINELMTGPSIFLKLRSVRDQETEAEFVKRFKDVIGPKDPVKARKTAIESVRATFGKDESRHALLCPFYDWNKQ